MHYFRYDRLANITSAVKAASYLRGTTNTAEALRFLRENMLRSEHGDRPNIPNVAVVITDGNSDDNKNTIEEAIKVKEVAHLIVINVGNWVNHYELDGIFFVDRCAC